MSFVKLKVTWTREKLFIGPFEMASKITVEQSLNYMLKRWRGISLCSDNCDDLCSDIVL